MQFLKWGPNIETGVKLIDGQHKYLIDLMNDVSESIHKMQDRQAASTALEGMKEYAEFHFSEEEKLMEQSGYPGLKTHIKEHDLFRDKVLRMENACALGQDAECLEVFEFLAHWIMEHIMGRDKLYIPYVKQPGLDERDGKG